jgi:cyclophilin family peptidyl-prolyl cis-trans isomerase
VELLNKSFQVADAFPPRAAPEVRPPLAIPTAAGPNPLVEIVTDRGSMVFELFRDETPVHVHNFLELVRREHYDGLGFHRVVPDFVVQGGDPRGDGNGGTTWRGVALRREFTPRKYVRGSLGMPRNDDPDSGGSQIFVTHRETPHLDGRYTLFGELRRGIEVLDAIEVGDTIRSVRLLDPNDAR